MKTVFITLLFMAGLSIGYAQTSKFKVGFAKVNFTGDEFDFTGDEFDVKGSKLKMKVEISRSRTDNWGGKTFTAKVQLLHPKSGEELYSTIQTSKLSSGINMSFPDVCIIDRTINRESGWPQSVKVKITMSVNGESETVVNKYLILK